MLLIVAERSSVGVANVSRTQTTGQGEMLSEVLSYSWSQFSQVLSSHCHFCCRFSLRSLMLVSWKWVLKWTTKDWHVSLAHKIVFKSRTAGKRPAEREWKDNLSCLILRILSCVSITCATRAALQLWWSMFTMEQDSVHFTPWRCVQRKASTDDFLFHVFYHHILSSSC